MYSIILLIDVLVLLNLISKLKQNDEIESLSKRIIYFPQSISERDKEAIISKSPNRYATDECKSIYMLAKSKIK